MYTVLLHYYTMGFTENPCTLTPAHPPAPSIYYQLIWPQCCGAGADSQGAEIRLPPGAGAEIMHCGATFFLFTTDMKKYCRKNHGG
jgi:hypothetical protein